ncbi:MAG: hypothetical protein HYW05_01140 [Candidatus Diapherotrites archaeon]|nr:hypothetical protein [Candidatus Diapherotrites archaeon]
MNAKLLLAFAVLSLFLLNNASAIWPWDECNSPSGGTIYPGGSASGWIAGWVDGDDWVSVNISSSGEYNFWLTGPSNADFDLQVYSNCSGSWVCGSAGGSSSESCTKSISSGTYHMRVLAYGYWDSGNWTMGATKKATTCYTHNYSACYSNDRYWYNSCGTREEVRYDCGDDSYGSWNNYYCSSNDVYRSRSFTDRGCSSDSCFANSSTQYELYQDCGDSSYGSWSSNYCSSNNVTQSRTVYNKGCSSGSCTSSNTTETRVVDYCSSNETCESGQCKPKCTSNAYTSCYNGDIYWYDSCNNRQEIKTDCGDTTYGSWGNSYCSSNNVMQTRNVYGPYCESSQCKSQTTTESRIAETCDGQFNFCLGNSCILCDSHTSYQCTDNDVYWFNSCGTKEDKKQECGSSYCDAWSGNSCKDGSVVRSRTCYDKGCGSNACYANPDTQYESVETCQYGCSGGACIQLSDLSIAPEDIIFEKT